jgi:hypothetical protein
VAELGQAWAEAAPRLASRKLSLDLHNVTYADVSGKHVLRDIYAQTGARLIASTPWTQFLAGEVTSNNADRIEMEAGNEGND